MFGANQPDYRWRAELDDGTVLNEGNHGSFTKVPAERIKTVTLVPQRRGLNPVVVQVNQGERAVFFRRHKVTLDPNGIKATKHDQVVCVGIEGKAWQFCFPDGRVLLTSDLGAV